MITQKSEWKICFDNLLEKAREFKDDKFIEYMLKTKTAHKPRARTLFEAALRGIQSIRVSHQRSVNVATYTFETLKKKFPNINDDKLITPENLLKLTKEELKKCLPFPNRQIDSYLTLLYLFRDNKIDTKNFDQIMKIKGIGKWTYNTSLLLYLLNPKDSNFSINLLKENIVKFPINDIALKKGYAAIHNINSDDIEFKTVENWGNKYGFFVPYLVQLLWQAVPQTKKRKRRRIKK